VNSVANRFGGMAHSPATFNPVEIVNHFRTEALGAHINPPDCSFLVSVSLIDTRVIASFLRFGRIHPSFVADDC